MTEVWTQAVRSQLDVGRLLPLGGPLDGTWITEQAAVQALRSTAAEVPGVRLESLRIGSAPLQPVSQPAVRPPASALPPGPLIIEAAFTASLVRPLPETADALRSALLGAATERLGLATVSADMRVTDLREVTETGVPVPETGVPVPETGVPVTEAGVPVPEAGVPVPEAGVLSGTTAATAVRPTPEAVATRNSPPVTGTESMRGLAGELAAVAAGVPGVARLTAVLGSRPVRVEDHVDPPGRHIEVHLAVGPGHHPLSVARAVREAVAGAATTDTPAPVTVAVLITETAAWRVTPPVTVMSAP
ncbi:hypothetical protein ACIGDI_24830 [Streptomyces sp. NPDC085900]|uniref:hypothetical protein n=1 Tax=Streptomyces sp. NPDC085900 TaxID=3365737 RepID=UPI0037CCFF6E